MQDHWSTKLQLPNNKWYLPHDVGKWSDPWGRHMRLRLFVRYQLKHIVFDCYWDLDENQMTFYVKLMLKTCSFQIIHMPHANIKADQRTDLTSFRSIFFWVGWKVSPSWIPQAYPGCLGNLWAYQRCIHTHQLPGKILYLSGRISYSSKVSFASLQQCSYRFMEHFSVLTADVAISCLTSA